MEQQLDATYLRPRLSGLLGAIAITALCFGCAVLLAAWGISLLWAHPQRIVVHQEKPFAIEQPRPVKVEPTELTVKVEQAPPVIISGASAEGKTSSGEIIRREVVVFSEVDHRPGRIVTGWKYADGSGGTPIEQYCYYTVLNPDQSSRKVDLASNGRRLPHMNTELVPDAERALAKCYWWKA
jgi:hypothetical protein